MIIRICPICKKKFKVWSYEVKKGVRKHCSRICYNKRRSVEFKCDYCGKKTKRDLNAYRKVKHHFCSQICAGKFLKISPRKRKKFYITDNGYMFTYKPNHPSSNENGYVYEHRLVAEKYLGRYLKSTEPIHHIGIKYSINSDKNKLDNRSKNLYFFSTLNEHTKYHWKIKKNTAEKLISNLM